MSLVRGVDTGDSITPSSNETSCSLYYRFLIWTPGRGWVSNISCTFYS